MHFSLNIPCNIINAYAYMSKIMDDEREHMSVLSLMEIELIFKTGSIFSLWLASKSCIYMHICYIYVDI